MALKKPVLAVYPPSFLEALNELTPELKEGAALRVMNPSSKTPPTGRNYLAVSQHDVERVEQGNDSWADTIGQGCTKVYRGEKVDQGVVPQNFRNF